MWTVKRNLDSLSSLSHIDFLHLAVEDFNCLGWKLAWKDLEFASCSEQTSSYNSFHERLALVNLQVEELHLHWLGESWMLGLLQFQRSILDLLHQTISFVPFNICCFCEVLSFMAWHRYKTHFVFLDTLGQEEIEHRGLDDIEPGLGPLSVVHFVDGNYHVYDATGAEESHLLIYRCQVSFKDFPILVDVGLETRYDQDGELGLLYAKASLLNELLAAWNINEVEVNILLLQTYKGCFARVPLLSFFFVCIKHQLRPVVSFHLVLLYLTLKLVHLTFLESSHLVQHLTTNLWLSYLRWSNENHLGHFGEIFG